MCPSPWMPKWPLPPQALLFPQACFEEVDCPPLTDFHLAQQKYIEKDRAWVRPPPPKNSASSNRQVFGSPVSITADEAPTTRLPHRHHPVHDCPPQALERWEHLMPHATLELDRLHVQEEDRQYIEHEAEGDLFLAWQVGPIALSASNIDIRISGYKLTGSISNAQNINGFLRRAILCKGHDLTRLCLQVVV